MAELDRLVQFGYRTAELQKANLIGEIPPTADSLKIKVRKNGHDPQRRFPAAVSTGIHVRGVVLPRPDLVDPGTVVHGIQKRFGHKPPDVDPDLFEELLDYTRKYVRRFVPIQADSDFDLETWLATTNYPEWRKVELRQAHSAALDLLSTKGGMKQIRRVGSFGKAETYPVFKYLRPINARSDEFKTLVGPAFRLIEKVVFSDPSFIKKVPRAEWPTFIQDHINSSYFIYTSDYSSFEALFEELMDVELILYEWMLQYHPDKIKFVRMIDDENHCYFKHVIAQVWRKRMSGEMNTSLGNGFTAHIVAKFVVHKLFGKDCIILQEGDDTVFASPGELDASLFTRLGLEIKLERVTDITRAQFCQLIFDDQELSVVRDPIPYIVGFGWIDGKYAGTRKYDDLLLRARAMSCLAQYPGHPVLQSFAQWIMRATRSTATQITRHYERDRSVDSYHREVILSAVADQGVFRNTPVGAGSRRLVEEQFGVEVIDQLMIESYFNKLGDKLQPIDFDVVAKWVHPDWLICEAAYVRLVDVRVPTWMFANVGPTAS